jgi:hypothetical protein
MKENKYILITNKRTQNGIIQNIIRLKSEICLLLYINIEDKAELFEIIGIQEAINRPDYWDIPEHRRRNVLILSRKIRDYTWSRVKNEIEKPNWGTTSTNCDEENLLHSEDDVYT